MKIPSSFFGYHLYLFGFNMLEKLFFSALFVGHQVEWNLNAMKEVMIT